VAFGAAVSIGFAGAGKVAGKFTSRLAGKSLSITKRAATQSLKLARISGSLSKPGSAAAKKYVRAHQKNQGKKLLSGLFEETSENLLESIGGRQIVRYTLRGAQDAAAVTGALLIKYYAPITAVRP
jgi:hypothetical protein